MTPLDEPTCHLILELPEGATLDEISHAYHLLKRVYGSEGANFAAPAMEEFATETRTQVLEDIEAAYAELCRIHAERHLLPHPPVKSPEALLPVDGPPLLALRASAGVSLEHLASQTHIRLEYLTAMEEERFQDLPLAAVTLRGFLTAYVVELGLTPEQVVPDYMHRFEQWQAQKPR